MYLTSYCLKLIYVIDIFYTLRFLLVLAIFFCFSPLLLDVSTKYKNNADKDSKTQPPQKINEKKINP